MERYQEALTDGEKVLAQHPCICVCAFAAVEWCNAIRAIS